MPPKPEAQAADVSAPAVRRSLVRCNVSVGRTVHHDHKDYHARSEVHLPRDEYERLAALGFVYGGDELDAIVAAQPIPSEGSDKEEGPGVDKTAGETDTSGAGPRGKSPNAAA